MSAWKRVTSSMTQVEKQRPVMTSTLPRLIGNALSPAENGSEDQHTDISPTIGFQSAETIEEYTSEYHNYQFTDKMDRELGDLSTVKNVLDLENLGVTTGAQHQTTSNSNVGSTLQHRSSHLKDTSSYVPGVTHVTSVDDDTGNKDTAYVSYSDFTTTNIHSESEEMLVRSTLSISTHDTTGLLNGSTEMLHEISGASTTMDDSHVTQASTVTVGNPIANINNTVRAFVENVKNHTEESHIADTNNTVGAFIQNVTEHPPTSISTAFVNLISSAENATATFLPPHGDITSNVSFNATTTVFPYTSSCELFDSSADNVTGADLLDVIVQQFDVSGDAALVAKAVTLTLLAVAGVAGNASLIWSVVRQQHLHRPPFYYLLSLSLTDLSRAAFCLPLVFMTLLQGSVWRHGTSACDLFAFANAFFVLSSGVSLLNVAADRHLSLVYPRGYKRWGGGAVNLVVVLLGWVLAFLVAFPPVVGVGAYAFVASEGQCTLRHKFFRHDNDTLGFLLVFSLLLLITLFLYYRVFLALRAHRRMRPLDHEPARSSTWTFVGPGANGQAFINWVNGFGGVHAGNVPALARHPPRPNVARVVSLTSARNQHLIRLFFLMTVAFSLAWLPYQVLSYWRVFGAAEEIGAGFVTVAAWVSYGQVVVCPLVYFGSRGGSSRRRSTSRADVSPDDKQQELLLESLHRKK